jgi:methionine sulfoxide reductase heme-binding subunit
LTITAAAARQITRFRNLKFEICNLQFAILPIMQTLRKHGLNWLVHAVSIVMLLSLGIQYALGMLGVNPVQKLIQESGEAGIRLLMLSIACTPARILFGFKQAATVRRALGLYGFAFVCLHLFAFAFLDFRLDLELILIELTEKPYIVAGTLAFLLMIPLAITSTKRWQKQLGKAWQTLHRVFYAVMPLGVLHFWWSQKADLNQALTIYAPVLLLLLAVRIPALRQRISQLRNPARVAGGAPGA